MINMYDEEKKLALCFLNDCGYKDKDIQQTIHAASMSMRHSDRWSIYFDVMFEHYKDYPNRSKIITGLAYLTDERKI